MPPESKDLNAVLVELTEVLTRVTNQTGLLTEFVTAQAGRDAVLAELAGAVRESTATARSAPPDPAPGPPVPAPSPPAPMGFPSQRRLILEYQRLSTDLGHNVATSVYVAVSRQGDNALELKGQPVATATRAIAYLADQKELEAWFDSRGSNTATASFQEYVPEGTPIELRDRSGDPVASVRWTQSVPAPSETGR